MTSIPWISLLFAVLLSGHGYRKKSLSPGGSLTAFVVGTGLMSGGLRVFGVSLIVFYLTGSRATKFGKQRKAKLEDGYHEAGYRDGWQVLSNSFTALLACTAWNLYFAKNSPQAQLFGSFSSTFQYNDGADWCPLDQSVSEGWSRMFLFAVLGHFACCLGDTLASELGVLSKSRPILITTLKPVPPGTNGGVSTVGTLASITGGLIIGLAMSICLLIESPACRSSSTSTLITLALYGAVFGGAGSMIDSLLGATIQETRYSMEQKKIVGSTGQVISGLNFLSNNQVNVASSVLTALGAAWLGRTV